jgi:hypothetical protein
MARRSTTPTAGQLPSEPESGQVIAASAPLPRPAPAEAPYETNRELLRQLLLLALPVLAEHLLHILVGLNDTYLANHLPAN